MNGVTPAVQRNLHTEYIVVLIERLRRGAINTESLCDRIERNLDLYEAMQALAEDESDEMAALEQERARLARDVGVLGDAVVEMRNERYARDEAGVIHDPDAWPDPLSKPASDMHLPFIKEAGPGQPVGNATTADIGVAPSDPAGASEPHDAVPAALTDEAGEASGAPPDQPVVINGGSVKPALAKGKVICPACGREIAARQMTNHHRHAHAGATEAIEQAQDDEAAGIREVAARIKAREATPAQNEQTGETFEERRLRFARERVASGRSGY